MRVSAHKKLPQLIGSALVAGCALLSHLPLQAQTSSAEARLARPTLPGPTQYSDNRGRWILGAQVGYSMEYGLDWHEVSHIQTLIAQPQIGFIVRNFQRSPVRRFEIIDEGIFGGSVHPRPAEMAGNTLIVRLEGKEHGRWVPFFDAGAGVMHTPLSRHVPELNGFTQFTPQGGLGLEYFIRPQRAVVFEWRTVHMSNAGTVPPNQGFNSTMLTVGFRWLRRPAKSGYPIIR
jgi:hypothetical protein